MRVRRPLINKNGQTAGEAKKFSGETKAEEKEGEGHGFIFWLLKQLDYDRTELDIFT